MLNKHKIRAALLKTRRGLLLLLFLTVASVYGIYKVVTGSIDKIADDEFVVPLSNVYMFKGVTGPANNSIMPIEDQHLSWRVFDNVDNNALAVLLTDTTADWLGIAQGLSGIGIPFVMTNSATKAAQHKAILVYPKISGKLLNAEDLKLIASLPEQGHTLIGTNIYGGGLSEVFGYEDILPAGGRNKFILGDSVTVPSISNILSELTNSTLAIAGNGIKSKLETVGYTSALHPLIKFEDGSAALTYKPYGNGHAYALGIDIGNFFQRYLNGRGFDPNRGYVNTYDAGIDVFLRILHFIYTQAEPNAVTISPTAYGKSLTLVLTHDIDFTRSIVNAAAYADMERDKGVLATYFIQTKYIKDWNDDIFFNSSNLQYLQRLYDNGMEIGSHSVSHSKTFSKFEIGTGKESYPEYRPFVKERYVTKNASIMGELRVSKYLLEHFTNGLVVRSFRPGHLQYPFALPQCLVAAGYKNNSSVTSGTVQTNLPYMLMYNRGYGGLTNIVEVPIAVEDELGLPMIERLDSAILLARKLARYGGVLNVLIHTDILGQKYEFERQLIDSLKMSAWVTTIDSLGNWWRGRQKVNVGVIKRNRDAQVQVNYNGETLNGITLQLPIGWQLASSTKYAKQQGRNVVLYNLSEPRTILFTTNNY